MSKGGNRKHMQAYLWNMSYSFIVQSGEYCRRCSFLLIEIVTIFMSLEKSTEF